MILEKKILTWNNKAGITDDYLDVISVSKSEFPKLIFQDFMNQLKIPKIKIGFELNTANLIELCPNELEQLDETSKLDLNKCLNKMDLLNYYLLSLVLRVEFNSKGIYTDNHNISTLYFESEVPFSSEKQNNVIPDLIRHVLRNSKSKDVDQAIERFFVLLGNQYRDKLLLFLTYLDTKYKFKVDKMAFIDSTLGEESFKRIKTNVLHKLTNYA